MSVKKHRESLRKGYSLKCMMKLTTDGMYFVLSLSKCVLRKKTSKTTSSPGRFYMFSLVNLMIAMKA